MPALKMACRLASVPVLTVSVLKRLQDLGISFYMFCPEDALAS
jgi:hypothetical protein